MNNTQVDDMIKDIMNKCDESEKQGQEKYDLADTMLQSMKSDAVSKGDQALAKAIWCCQTILKAHWHYQTAFVQMHGDDFYVGWCSLEQAELQLHFLERHYTTDEKDSFGITFMSRQIPKFQAIFPYKMFMSPGFIKEEVICSICEKKISIRSHCGHMPGEIYDGEQCGRIITKSTLLEISMTPDPLQKYSVTFLVDEKTGERVEYDYTRVKYVVQGLRSPFHDWDMEETTIRHPHRLFADVDFDEDCPCGSDIKYKDCCLPVEEGVLRPHMRVTFHVPPPPNLPSIVYPGDDI